MTWCSPTHRATSRTGYSVVRDGPCDLQAEFRPGREANIAAIAFPGNVEMLVTAEGQVVELSTMHRLARRLQHKHAATRSGTHAIILSQLVAEAGWHVLDNIKGPVSANGLLRRPDAAADGLATIGLPHASVVPDAADNCCHWALKFPIAAPRTLPPIPPHAPSCAATNRHVSVESPLPRPNYK